MIKNKGYRVLTDGVRKFSDCATELKQKQPVVCAGLRADHETDFPLEASETGFQSLHTASSKADLSIR